MISGVIVRESGRSSNREGSRSSRSARDNWMPAVAGMTVWRSCGFRQGVLGFGIGPIEPQRERLDVAALDGRTAPDAKPGGGVAVGVDVVGAAFFLQRRGEAFHESR